MWGSAWCAATAKQAFAADASRPGRRAMTSTWPPAARISRQARIQSPPPWPQITTNTSRWAAAERLASRSWGWPWATARCPSSAMRPANVRAASPSLPSPATKSMSAAAIRPAASASASLRARLHVSRAAAALHCQSASERSASGSSLAAAFRPPAASTADARATASVIESLRSGYPLKPSRWANFTTLDWLIFSASASCCEE